MVHYNTIAVAAATAAAKTTVEAAVAATAETYGAPRRRHRLAMALLLSPHILTTALRHLHPIYQNRSIYGPYLVLVADQAYNWGSRG